MGFGGSQPGAGRPKTPRAVDVLRERIETDIDKWLKPLEEALGAERIEFFDDGKPQYGPDHGTRLRAVAEAFDRAHGKPRQATEIEVPSGAAVLGAVLVVDPKLAEDSRGLLRRAASVGGDVAGGARGSDQ